MRLRIKRQFLRKLWYTVWGIIAGAVIALALIFSVIRMLLPYAADYKHDIEDSLSDLSGYKVSIDSIEAGWRWLTPQIKLNKLDAGSRETNQSIHHLDAVEVGIDLFSSIATLDLSFSYVNVIGASINVRRDKENIYIGNKQISLARQSSDKGFRIPEVLDNKTLRLLNSRVVYSDEVLGVEGELSEVNVSLRNFDESRELFISLELPESIGETLEVAFDLTGRRDNPASWNGNAYVRTKSVEISKISQHFSKLDAFKSGSISFELWFDWESRQVMEVKGDITVENAELNPIEHAAAPTLLNSLSMQVYSKRDGNTLEMVLRDLKLIRDGNEWQPGDWAALAELDVEENLIDLQASIDFIRFEDLLPLIQRIPHGKDDVISQIESIHPQGELSNLFLNWNKDKDFNLAVDFESLGIPGSEQLPSVSGLSGRLDVSKKGGLINLDSNNVSVFVNKIFRDPIMINRLKTDIKVYRLDNDEILLSSNDLLLEVPEVSANTRFSIWLGNREAQYLDIYSSFRQADLKNKSLYLPAGIMSENVLKWLDDAVLGGTLSNVFFEFKGYTSQFPFKNGEGFFNAECDFSRGELKYLPDWPIAHELRGHLKFAGLSMYADVYSARVFDGEVTEVRAAIKDLRDPIFLMDAYAFSSAKDALRFIQESSLKNTFGPIVDDINASGLQGTWLSFAIPMHDNPDISYAGVSTLFNAGFSLPEFNVDLSQLNNEIYFNEFAVLAKDSSIKFNDRESAFAIKTTEYKNWSNVQLSVIGQYSFDDLFDEKKHAIVKYLHGDSEFSIGLDIPFAGNKELLPSITLGSRLKGIKSSLPEPLSKAKNKAETLYLVGQFLPDERAELDFYYSSWFKSKFLLEKQRNDIVMQSGEIRMRNGTPKIPKRGGIQVTGYLDALDLDHWMKIRDEISRQNSGFFSEVNQIKVTADLVKYLGAGFAPATISSKKDSGFWLFNVESPILKGDMQIADSNLIKDGVIIDLKYLDLNAFDIKGNDPVNPKDLPPIKFFTDKLVFKDWNLDKVSFLSAPFENGLRIHSLTVDDSTLNIRADGEWADIHPDQQQTNLHIVISSDNIGIGVTKLGYVDFVKEGNGHAEFNIKWPASPAAFDYSILNGNANLSFTKGQILDVNPGTGGRVFSLISLQTLPRRLALDFKDVFSKGFRFDTAQGDFTFADGNAFTSNFVIEGPAARMEVTGRTGLVNRDYDQSVKVATELSASLPVIGAILGGTSGGLAGILVDRIAKLFGKKSSDQGTIYTIKGSWDDPVIEKIKKKKNDKNQSKENSG